MKITENGETRPMSKDDLPKLRDALGLGPEEAGTLELVSCRELSPGDTIEHGGKRLVYHGYGGRRGSKLWQLHLTHEVGGGLVLLHLFPDDAVSRAKAANAKLGRV